MVNIKIKNSVVEPLFLYEPKLNDWHEKEHQLTYTYCVAFLRDIIEPIRKQIKEIETNERAKGRWHMCSGITEQAKNSCKFLKKVFTTCKQIQAKGNVEDITLSFID